MSRRMMGRRWNAPALVAASFALAFGLLPLRDEGSAGDYYVDPINGLDTNSGTSEAAPKKTVTATRGHNRHIKMRGGVFSEYIDLSGFTGITLSRYGIEEAVVSGLDRIPAGNWGVLQAADLPYFTAAQQAAGGIRRAVVPLSSIAGGHPRAAFLHEGWTPMQPAMLTDDNPLLPMHTMCERQWAVAAVATSSPITTFVLPVAHQGAGYTAAQVQNAEIHIHDGGGNFNHRKPITSYSTGTFEVQPTYGGSSYSRSAIASKQDRFALINFLPLLAKGGWGYRPDGANAILYAWPNDPASITNGTIGFAARAKGIKLGNGCEARGLHTIGHATTALTQNSAMGIDAQGTTGAKIDNCLIENVWNPEDGYGAIYALAADDLTVSNCHIKGAYGTLGYTLTGNFPGNFANMMTDAQRGQRNKIKLCTMEHVERSPCRWYGQDQSVILGLKATGPCGTQAHANKIEGYIQNSSCAWVGLDLAMSWGYATVQASSNMFVLTSELPGGIDYDGRGFDDQGSSSMPPPSTFGIGTDANSALSCRFPPHPQGLTGTWFDALMVGSSSGAVGTWDVDSCISHGIEVDGTGHTVNHNVLTAGTDPGGTGNTVVTLASVYADAATANRAYAPGAAFRSAARRDLSAKVAAIKAMFDNTGPGGTIGRLFTDAEFDIDAAGQPVNWAQAPRGCLNDYDAPLALPAHFLTAPGLSGTAQEGQTLTATAGTFAGYPTPTASIQWEESATDGLSWSDVAGATGLTYVLPTGAAGKVFRPRVTLTSSAGAPAVAYGVKSAVVTTQSLASLFGVSDMGFWLDPSDATTMFETSAETGSLEAGDPLGRLRDKSGKGQHFQQATSAKRPVWNTGSGLSWFDTDGTTTGLQSAATLDLSATDQVTLVLAVMRESTTLQMMAEHSASRSSNNGSFTLAGLSPDDYQFTSKGTSDGAAISGSGVGALGDVAVLTAQGDISADLSVLRRNGVQIATGSADQGTGNYGNYTFYIGGRGLTANMANIRVYGAFLINRLLSAGEIAQVEAWMAAKCGVTLP